MGADGERQGRERVEEGHAVGREHRVQLGGMQRVEHRAQGLVEQHHVGGGFHAGEGGAGEGGGGLLLRDHGGDGAQVVSRKGHLCVGRQGGVVAGAQDGGEPGAGGADEAGVGGEDGDTAGAQALAEERKGRGTGLRRHHVGCADDIYDIELAQLLRRDLGDVALPDVPARAEGGATGLGAGAGFGRGVDSDHAARALLRGQEQLRAGAAADVQHIRRGVWRWFKPQRRRRAAQRREAEPRRRAAVVGHGVVGAADLRGEAGGWAQRWRQGRPAAFQPAIRPRWPALSGLPSNPSATLKTFGKPAAWAAWAAASERTPERQRK